MPDNAKSTRDFVEQLREATDTELQDRMHHIHESLFNLRFRLASGQIEDPKRIRKYRKAIARIKTIQRERELNS
ncbi:MAG: 50S ribosomal protein L29 [candidate division WS1 bacterium]|jgi:large subunit ribosomal protein L29|nr:50S ribosomal protein L29 [candidate division WS1 bacterium]